MLFLESLILIVLAILLILKTKKTLKGFAIITLVLPIFAIALFFMGGSVSNMELFEFILTILFSFLIGTFYFTKKEKEDKWEEFRVIIRSIIYFLIVVYTIFFVDIIFQMIKIDYKILLGILFVPCIVYLVMARYINNRKI